MLCHFEDRKRKTLEKEQAKFGVCEGGWDKSIKSIVRLKPGGVEEMPLEAGTEIGFRA